MTIDKHAVFLELISRLRQVRDPVYNRSFDSMDICQSVMASFFLRAVLGHYHINDSKQLVKRGTLTRSEPPPANRRGLHHYFFTRCNTTSVVPALLMKSSGRVAPGSEKQRVSSSPCNR